MTTTLTISTPITDEDKARLYGFLGGAPATGGNDQPSGDTSAPAQIDYFPADPANAPFPSPENSQITVIDGKISGKPYIKDSQGAIWRFKTDASGNPVSDGNAKNQGWVVDVNGAYSSNAAITMLVVRQGQVYFLYNGGHSAHFSQWNAPGSGVVQMPLPPAWVDGTGGTGGSGNASTPGLPPMPNPPPPAAVQPGSSGKVILFGTNQTYKTLTDALSAAANGDTLKAGPEMAGVKLNESINISKNVLIDGGLRLAGCGTKSPSIQTPGLILDGTPLADPGGYAKQLGGLVPTVDCKIMGMEIMGYGIKETEAGGTAGIRPGAPCNIVLDHIYSHDNQNGLQSGNYTVTWDLDHIWLADNGIGDGQTHNCYFSGSTCVKVRVGAITSIVTDAPSVLTATGKKGGGHAFKTRSHDLQIDGPFYLSAWDGRCIDICDGTTKPFKIDNGTFHKDADADNHQLIAYGPESQTNGLAGGTLDNIVLDALCDAPTVKSAGGTISFTNTTSTGKKVTGQGGTFTGLPN
jgi:hypothetical protein